MPLWVWLAIGAVALVLALVALAIWSYPQDGSF